VHDRDPGRAIACHGRSRAGGSSLDQLFLIKFVNSI
jgi:hypothetical protein